MKKSFILGGILSCLPLFAGNGEDTVFAAFGLVVVAFIVMFAITIFFLISQSSFAKSMRLKNRDKETSSIWIWTQLIPIWNFIAIPVTLIKLNEQFNTYILENDLLNSSTIKSYNNTWGWVWYIGSVVSIFIPFAGLISFIGVIGFWIHISNIRKSLITIRN